MVAKYTYVYIAYGGYLHINVHIRPYILYLISLYIQLQTFNKFIFKLKNEINIFLPIFISLFPINRIKVYKF